MAATATMGNFTVTKSNPSGTIVRFTVTDTNGLITTPKMMRAILCDAIQQWIDAERADLDTNGDSAVLGNNEYGVRAGDGFSRFVFNENGKYAQVTLTSISSISVSGTLTAGVAYEDVVG